MEKDEVEPIFMAYVYIGECKQGYIIVHTEAKERIICRLYECMKARH